MFGVESRKYINHRYPLVYYVGNVNAHRFAKMAVIHTEIYCCLNPIHRLRTNYIYIAVGLQVCCSVYIIQQIMPAMT